MRYNDKMTSEREHLAELKQMERESKSTAAELENKVTDLEEHLSRVSFRFSFT